MLRPVKGAYRVEDVNDRQAMRDSRDSGDLAHE